MTAESNGHLRVRSVINSNELDSLLTTTTYLLDSWIKRQHQIAGSSTSRPGGTENALQESRPEMSIKRIEVFQQEGLGRSPAEELVQPYEETSVEYSTDGFRGV